MSKSTSANIAKQARASTARMRRACAHAALATDPAHVHEWEALPALEGVPAQRRCTACRTIQTYNARLQEWV